MAFFLPGAFVALVVLALPWMLMSSIAGSSFLDQYAWAYGSGGITPSYSPNFSVFLSMLSDNALVTILISLGFVAGGFGIANVVFVNAARVMMAMGIDGLLPRFVSEVHPRTHTPVKALTLWSTAALLVAAVFSFKPDWQTTVLLGGAITSVLVVGVSCLAGALLPYRARGSTPPPLWPGTRSAASRPSRSRASPARSASPCSSSAPSPWTRWP